MNTQKIYIEKYGNFSHILKIDITKGLCEDEKNKILSVIYGIINDKIIEKKIFTSSISIKWIVSNETHLSHYYTDVCGILGDRAVYEHTKLILNDIKKIVNKDKFNITLTKPLTKSICIL